MNIRQPHHASRPSKTDDQDTPDRSSYVVSTDPRARAAAIEQKAMAGKIEFYRNEAQRLFRLAASAAFDDAKAQFLALAQQYETLAEHAAERARRQRS
jgi:hypothetical protein